MDPALTVAVVSAAITAAGTVLTAVIRAWRTGPDRSRPEARSAAGQQARYGEVGRGADGMPGRSFVPVTADEPGRPAPRKRQRAPAGLCQLLADARQVDQLLRHRIPPGDRLPDEEQGALGRRTGRCPRGIR